MPVTGKKWSRRLFLCLSAGSVVSSAASCVRMARTGSVQTNSEVPVVLHTSQGIRPGQVLGVYGESFVPGQTRVVVKRLGPDGRLPTPETGVDVQLVDVQRHFALTVLPKTLVPGVYALWVGTPVGWSQPAFVNKPIAWWIEDRGCYTGQKLRVFGRNLAPVESGAHPAVRLVETASGMSLAALLIAADPYTLKFQVPSVMPGKKYTVHVSNGSGGPTAEAVVPQELTAVAVPKQDPIGLGVSWAGDFAWGRRVEAKSFGAKGDGQTDDTAAINAALQDVASKGGGVVLLNQGAYVVRGVDVPYGTVLMGISADTSKLVGLHGGRVKVTGSSHGRTGVARLLIGGQVVMGNLALSDRQMLTESIDRCFAVGCRIRDSGESPTLWIGARDRVLLRDNDIECYPSTPIWVLAAHEYVSIQGNRIKYGQGQLNFHGSRSVIEDNHLLGDQSRAKIHNNLHGIMLEGQQTGIDGVYVARNLIESVGSPDGNDGETICFEPPKGIIAAGTATGGDARGLTDANPPLIACGTYSCKPAGNDVQELINPGHRWQQDFFRHFSVVITEGRGMGQWRRIVGNDAHRIDVDRPWEVVPDATSRYAINSLGQHMLWLDNVTRSSRAAMQLYYNCVDNVVAGNRSTDTQGLYVKAHNTAATMMPAFFNCLHDNRVEGVSPVFGTGIVGLLYDGVPVMQGALLPTGVYGNEVRGNTVIAPASGPKAAQPGFSQFSRASGIPIRVFSPAPGPGILGTIVEGNTISGNGFIIHLAAGTSDTLLKHKVADGPIEDIGSVRSIIF